MCTSLTYSRASVALASALNVSVLKPSHFVKSTHFAAPSSRSIGHRCHASTMFAHSRERPSRPMASVQLTLFAVDTPVSRTLSPGSDAARMTTVTSGLKCLDSSANCGPLGSLERMLVGTSRWGSTACFLTWKVKATKRGHLLFRLAASMPRTEETGCGLWQTPVADDAVARENGKWNSRGEPKLSAQAYLWPTPTVNGNYNRKGLTKSSGDGLATAVRMWPTPTATDYRAGYGMTEAGMKRMEHTRGKPLRDAVTAPPSKMWLTPNASDADKWNNQSLAERKAKGQQIRLNNQVSPEGGKGGLLNPTWVEWLMGYPLGWTELSPSEMASYLKSRRKSDASLRQSRKA